jgi:hypothetical protein
MNQGNKGEKTEGHVLQWFVVDRIVQKKKK